MAVLIQLTSHLRAILNICYLGTISPMAKGKSEIWVLDKDVV